MCYRHLSNATFCDNLDNNDPSAIVQQRVNKFAEKCKSILTNNEYEFLNLVIKHQTFACSLNYISQRK